MSGSGYKILGFVVWQGAKFFVRRRYGRYVPSRRMATAGLVVGAVAVVAVVGAKRDA